MYNYIMKNLSKRDLSAVLREINKRFDETKQRHEDLQKALNESVQELVRLQGEYRLIQNLKKTDTLKTKQK